MQRGTFSRIPNSLTNLLRSVREHYCRNTLHELPDETLMTYARIRHLPLTGNREDLIRRFYKYIFRRVCQKEIHLFYYDLEFTGTPRWSTENGIETPDQEIVEVAAYHPTTNSAFTRLVSPEKYTLTEEAAALTQLTQEQLQKEGQSIDVILKALHQWIGNKISTAYSHKNPDPNATEDMLQTIQEINHVFKKSLDQGKLSPTVSGISHNNNQSTSPQNGKFDENNSNIMLISHGGFMHDARMIRYYSTLKNVQLPSRYHFADSCRLLRECTQNNGAELPKLKLSALLDHFDIKPLEKSHRALSDAIGTWNVLESAISKYGLKHLTPTEEIKKKFIQWNHGTY